MTSTEAPSSDEKAATLRALNVPGDPLMLPNAWDAASARMVEAAGSRSWPRAALQRRGYVGTVAVGMPFVPTLYAQQVLGYSALEFGVGSVVLAVGVTVGAIIAQAAVLKALQPGGALGVAIVTTVAVSRYDDFLAATDGANPLLVLTEDFQSAFVACVVLAGIGLALALLLMGRPRRAPQEALEAVPVPIQNVPALETEGG